MFRSHDRFGAGVHNSIEELTSLANQPIHLFCSLINPTVLAWLNFVVSLAMCELANVPYSLWESCPSWGWHCC